MVQKSGKVLVVKLENEIQKKVIMRNKNKLKREKIFIENDLCWEDTRKVQEEMNKWARIREKGKEVKIGYGRANIKGIGGVGKV